MVGCVAVCAAYYARSRVGGGTERQGGQPEGEPRVSAPQLRASCLKRPGCVCRAARAGVASGRLPLNAPFSDGVFLSGFCIEGSAPRVWCVRAASSACLQCASRVSVRRERQGSCRLVKKPSLIVSTILYITQSGSYYGTLCVSRKHPTTERGAAPPQINCNGTAPSVEPTAVEPYKP